MRLGLFESNCFIRKIVIIIYYYYFIYVCNMLEQVKVLIINTTQQLHL